METTSTKYYRYQLFKIYRLIWFDVNVEIQMILLPFLRSGGCAALIFGGRDPRLSFLPQILVLRSSNGIYQEEIHKLLFDEAE